jgi:hypothetical protein
MADVGYIKFDVSDARAILIQELTELQAKIADNMRNAGEVASGKTIASMHVVHDEQQASLLGRVAFGALETGRRPGNVPKNFYTIIRKWMRDKGLHGEPKPYVRQGNHKYTPQERGDRQMAWGIVFKTKKEGSKLFRDKGRDDIYSNEIPITLQRIGDRLFKMVTMEVQSIKINKTPKFGG